MDKKILLLISILVLPLTAAYEGLECNVPIIYLHDIQENTTSYIHTSVDDFTNLIDWLYDNNYTTITLVEYYSWRGGSFELPKKPIVIVFDDAFKGVETYAYPIMKEKGYKGVLALLTDNMDEKIRMNYSESISLFNDGWEIASHSKSHINLLNASKEERMQEFSVSKYEIYNNTCIMPISFITPFNFQNSTTGDECLSEYKICTGWGHSEKWNLKLAPHPVTLSDLPRLIINNNTDMTAMKKFIEGYDSQNKNCNIHVDAAKSRIYQQQNYACLNDKNTNLTKNQTIVREDSFEPDKPGKKILVICLVSLLVFISAIFFIYKKR